MRLLSSLLFLFYSLPLSLAVDAQDSVGYSELGLPYFYEHFTPQQYRQHHQNWAVTQDPRGLIYVANVYGILEYDGASWRLIPTKTNTVIRSLDVGPDGIVYAGAQGDFGYLEPDSTGSLRYVSLIEHVRPALRDFKDVWGVRATTQEVFFQTSERLFRWDGEAMQVWESKGGYRTSFIVRGRFYVREQGVGLMRAENGRLRLIPEGEAFEQLPVFMMAPYGDDEILIGTREAGLLLYDGQSIVPFPTEADEILERHRLYHGCALPGGFYALATLGGGIIVIDDKGRLVQILDEATGFPDNWINFVFVDRQGGLWTALNDNGIARVDIPSQLTVYDRRLGLDGVVLFMQRFRDRLYVATSTGLYYLQRADVADDARRQASFVQVLAQPVHELLVADSVLFIAANNGVHILRESGLSQVTSDPSYALVSLDQAAARVVVGTKSGLSVLEHTSSGWIERRGAVTLSDEVWSLAEDETGALWLGTRQGQVVRLRIDGSEAPPKVEYFDERHGLPPGELWVTAVDKRVVLVSKEGIYQVMAATPDAADGVTFVKDTTMMPPAAAFAGPLHSFVVDGHGNIWMSYAGRIVIARPADDGRYTYEEPAVLSFPKEDFTRLYVEDNGIVWIGNGSSLIRYDPSIAKQYDASFPVYVRQVAATGTEQVVYGGAPEVPGRKASVPAFSYEYNDLRFEFAAPTYNRIADTEFQYYLEGHDPGWSAWASQSRKLYTGLGGGRYRFRVRARNAQGIVGQEAVFEFRMLPPWYQTWWAYSAYGMLVLGLAALAWRYHVIVQENKRAREQARELARERIVNERLQQANKRLQEANESLEQANKLKDEFLANTSHELRTPLTAILGFTAVLQEELPEQYRELIDPIESNGQRLLHTVNLLLDIAKLRAGMMEVHPEEIDVREKTAEVVRLLSPLADRKGLGVHMELSQTPVRASLDQRFFERILYNLIGNAIKFTDEGEVRVEVEQRADWVQVRVRDTGIGIDAAFIPHLFDEFKQESTGLARLHEGSGLGLAITARLVELMGGTIDVESEKGRGSIFTVSFPSHAPEPASSSAV